MTRTLTKSNIENASINTYLLPPHGNSQNTKDRDKHYSQVKQDEVVYEILQKKKGFFLEIGAHDGQYLSNTLWLEKQHKWTGLLIEGNPDRCKEIDKLKRNAWRLCACLSNSQTNISFIKDGDIGGIEDHLDEHHMKILDRKNKIFVPCFAIEHILNKISVHHIDFFSLNAEGGEMAVLKSMRSSLKYGMLTVDVWSIEYSVRDNHQTLVEKSKENLKFFRKYFDELGGYFEHSQLSTDDNTKDGYAVDVVFVRIGEWCKTKVKFPNGTDCPKKQKAYRIDDFLLHPFPFEKVKDADKRYSQAKQDQVAYDILKKQSGFFVDIGAHDGQFLSNTLWLERQHAWTGLLIEANPDLCKKIDKLKRHAWRLCACLSNTLGSVTFIKGDTVGGVESHIDEHHMKMVQKKDKITVPCYNLESVLDEIKTYHIDFFSLDVEGAEMAVLESLRDGLETNSFTVDLWSIEYRVWDGKQVVYEKSLENLNSLRWYFHSIGGYSEHSQLSNDENFSDGYALDVVFVRNKILCKNHKTLPNGMACSN
uniref:Methyltransferase FkbM domain-containing protein n=1 Tax=Magallana gigas TaxID=29159 RepID=K1S2G7_MAGGI